MQKEFTKADLKDGMVVEQCDRDRYLVVGNRVLSLSGYNELSQYSDDFINNIYGEEYGIKKIYKVKNGCVNSLEEIFNDKNLELIWERNEAKRMTAEEMRQKLEELTGEKIEVEPSREEMVCACYEFCDKRECSGECVLADSGDCVFKNYSDERLKECYEKVIANGK